MLSTSDELKKLHAAHHVPLGFKVVAFVLICYGFAGTQDYNIAKAAEQEYRAAVKAKRAQDQPARIWSKRCEAQGKRVLATQADGGKWKIRCVNTNLKI